LELLKESPIEELHIDNTDIDSGLEHLATKKLVIYCSTNKNLHPEPLCRQVQKQLEPYNDYQA